MTEYKFTVTVEMPDGHDNADDPEWWGDAVQGALREYGAIAVDIEYNTPTIAGHEISFSGGGPIDGPDGFVGESVFLQLNGDDVVGLHEGPNGEVRAYVIDARYEIPMNGSTLDDLSVPVFPVHSSRQDEPEPKLIWEPVNDYPGDQNADTKLGDHASWCLGRGNLDTWTLELIIRDETCTETDSHRFGPFASEEAAKHAAEQYEHDGLPSRGEPTTEEIFKNAALLLDSPTLPDFDDPSDERCYICGQEIDRDHEDDLVHVIRNDNGKAIALDLQCALGNVTTDPDVVEMSYRLDVSIAADTVDKVIAAAIEHNETGDVPTTIQEAVQDLFHVPGGTAHIFQGTSNRAHTGWSAELIVEPAEPTLRIPDHLWKPNDALSDPQNILHVTVVVCGLSMHFEAWEVTHGDHYQMTAASPYKGELERIHEAVHGSGPFQTTTINGRSYVIIATPHCQ